MSVPADVRNCAGYAPFCNNLLLQITLLGSLINCQGCEVLPVLGHMVFRLILNFPYKILITNRNVIKNLQYPLHQHFWSYFSPQHKWHNLFDVQVSGPLTKHWLTCVRESPDINIHTLPSSKRYAWATQTRMCFAQMKSHFQAIILLYPSSTDSASLSLFMSVKERLSYSFKSLWCNL